MPGRILCVGLTCIDLVSIVSSYPAEDSDSQCQKQYWSRGGNASNNATVLAILDHPAKNFDNKPGLISCLNDGDLFYPFILSDLVFFGIDTKLLCRYNSLSGQEQGQTFGVGVNLGARVPMSTCLLSTDTGSRTICHHNKGAPEVPAWHFAKVVDPKSYRWIHFEGRVNVVAIEEMIERIRSWNQMFEANGSSNRIIVSVEMEKPRSEIDCLIDKADVTFVSKQRASLCGFSCPQDAVQGFMSKVVPGSVIVVPWGDIGAAAGISGGDKFFVPAHKPKEILDTLGAGDTFVASFLYRLNTLQSPAPWKFDHIKDALSFACVVAGEKCGQLGFSQFQKHYQSISTLIPNWQKNTQ